MTFIAQMGTVDQPEIIVTAIHMNDDYLLVDGNKRSVAFYEYSKKKEVVNIDCPIYILEFK